MPDEVREHLTTDQRPFLHPESLQTKDVTIHSTHNSIHDFIWTKLDLRQIVLLLLLEQNAARFLEKLKYNTIVIY